MRKIRMSVVGIGGRGTWWLSQLLKMDDVEIVGVCDKYEDRMQKARALCAEKYGREVFGSTDWQELVRRDDGAEAVLITTYWLDHARMAIAAMKNGKYAEMFRRKAKNYGEVHHDNQD